MPDELFRRQTGGAGLFVPDDLSRTRRVVTHADWRAIDRGLDALNRIDLKFQFRCEHGCPTIEKSRTPDGGTRLRCDCTDRLFTKAF